MALFAAPTALRSRDRLVSRSPAIVERVPRCQQFRHSRPAKGEHRVGSAGDDRLCFGFWGWRGGWHSHPSVLVRSKERFGRSRSTLETSFSSVPLARLEVEAFAPDVPSSRWTRSAVARCFLQMRLAVGCSDGDSIFPPAPWSFMSSTLFPTLYPLGGHRARRRVPLLLLVVSLPARLSFWLLENPNKIPSCPSLYISRLTPNLIVALSALPPNDQTQWERIGNVAHRNR